MKRFVIGLSVFLALSVNASAALGQEEPQFLPDNREASFLPPPESLLKRKDEEIVSQTEEEDTDVTPSVISENQPPVNAPAKMESVDLGQPVARKPLGAVDPQTVGLLSQAQGGLGADMWKGTSRELVDRLLPALALPMNSPVLNDLARRMLLSVAALPDGSGKASHSLMSLRIEKLIALGAVDEAWKLALLAKPDLVDKVTMRLLVEMALAAAPDSKAVCEKIPSFIEEKAKADQMAIEWQKALVVCKLQEKDQNAVQLGLDLLREQGAENDAFMMLMTRNVLARAKVLPRQLTPLRPLNMAVLNQLDLPLPPELYARPDAALIPALLKAKASKEKKRIELAERAAETGVLSAEQLAAAYKSAAVSSDEADDPKGPLARARLYQEIEKEQDTQKKMALVFNLLGDVPAKAMTGAMGQMAAGLIEAMPMTTDSNAASARAVRLMALAGRAEKAMAWHKIAQDVRIRLPEVDKEMVRDWPIYVFSGLVSDGDYAQGLKAWLDAFLVSVEGRDGREQAGKILLLLSASGYAVSEEIWLRVMDVLPAQKHLMASPLLVERLTQAGQAGRKAETVLLSLLVSAGEEETSVQAMADSVRALRQAGFNAESQALARAYVAGILMP